MNNIAKRRLLKVLQALVLFLILVVLFLCSINIYFNFAYQTTYVRGFSMYPTLNAQVTSQEKDGDQIYIKNQDLKVNDIVVAHVSWFKEGIIKRLVGCPGDEIQILEETIDDKEVYNLYVNGNLLYSKDKSTACLRDSTKSNASTFYYYNNVYLSFINNPTHANNVTTNDKGKCIILNDDEYFLMGDNWGETTDSLVNGPVGRNNIVGKVELIITPQENKAGAMIKFMFNKIFK